MDKQNVNEPHLKKLKTIDKSNQIDASKYPSNICTPITALADLWNFLKALPAWVDQIIEIKPRSSVVVQNVTSDCHTDEQNFIPKLRLDRNSVPRTLVCHDFKGGYLEDKYVNPVNVGNGYVFYRWSQIDIFVYFSHHFITIPPLCWINAAHANGVKILGTFITEWDDGKRICEEIFENITVMEKFVEALVDVSVLLHLDGWLLNIENKLNSTVLLKKFVKYLTEEMHKKRPGSLVIWYDSIITTGDLAWQNELNDLNRCYFDACDGIFLNYVWNETNMVNTMRSAKHRSLDVYVGVDVFGRNSYGGGKFNAYLAAKKIREYGFSMAIFAQGWTHETLPKEPEDNFLERFLNRDNAFWKSLWQYLYTHLITEPFNTFFYVGVDNEWFRLHNQQQQLSRILHPTYMQTEYENVPTLLNNCNCFQVHLHDKYTSCIITKEKLELNVPYIHKLFSCEIPINGTIIIYTYIKTIEEIIADGDLSLILLVQNLNGGFRKIICNSLVKNGELKNDFSLYEVNPSKNSDAINMVTYQNDVPNDWILRCYVLKLSSCKIIEIGATIENGKSVCLCGFGIKQAPLL